MHYCELLKGLNCLNNEVLSLVFSPALIKVHLYIKHLQTIQKKSWLAKFQSLAFRLLDLCCNDWAKNENEINLYFFINIPENQVRHYLNYLLF